MKRGMRMCLSVLALTLALCLPAGAVSGWEMHALKKEAVKAETVQAFLDKLNGEYVVNMQVRYELAGVFSNTPAEILPAIPNTLVDNAHYPRLADLLKALRPADGASSGKKGERIYLGVTTDDDTVFFCGDGDRLYVRGSLGEGVFSVDTDASRALMNAVDALPGVARARHEALRSCSQNVVASDRFRALDWAKEIVGDGKELLVPEKTNPAALRVDYRAVNTIQIYDGGRYYVAVTGEADRKRLCNLVNAVQPAKQLEKELSNREDDDSLRLEFRFFDGSKHEYQLADNTDNLVVDGKLYSDWDVVHIFGAVLADVYYRYPTRAAWLGYMNPDRIQSITHLTGTDTVTYTAGRQANRIERLAKELKDIRVYGAIPCRSGRQPEEIRDRAPSESYILTFDSGDVYNVARYGDEYLRVEWAGENENYLYRL